MGNKLLCLLFFTNFILINSSKSQCTGWARTGGPNNDNAWGIAVDGDANSYSAGYYQGPSVFGNYTANDTGLFLIKYDSLGNLLWVKTFAGSFYGIFSFLSYSHDAIYLSTTFYDTVSFGNYTIAASGLGISMGVVKFDTDGNVKWARTYSCTKNSFGYGIWNTSSGYPLITGRYYGTLTMGGTTLTGPSSGYSIFLAKLDAATGDVLWAKSSAVESYNGGRGYALRTDLNGNILLSGYYRYILAFGNQTLDNSSYSSSGPPFIAKFDSNGTALWIKGGKGPFVFDNVYGLEIDSLNNIYFSSPLDTTGTFSGTTVNPSNGSLVIGKYDASGNLLWVKQIGGHSGNQSNIVLSLHVNHNSTLTGYGWGYGTLYMGTDTFITATDSTTDLFVIHLDADGNYLSSSITGNICSETSYSAGYDKNDNAYVAGAFFGDTSTLGSFGLSGDTMFLGNYFVWKNCPDFATSVSHLNTRRIAIIPNPIQDQLNINLPSSPNEIVIRVYDLQGRMIALPPTFTNSKAQLNTSTLPNGFYTLQIINNKTGESEVEKFVKQK